MSSKSTKTIPGTCPRCGAPNHDSLRVCAYCGTVLVEDTVEPDSPKTPAAQPVATASVNPVSAKKPRPRILSAKPFNLKKFIIWSVLWAVNCAVLVELAPNKNYKDEALLMMISLGILSHLLIELIPAERVTLKVLYLAFILLVMLVFVASTIPQFHPIVLLLITAAAFIWRRRQLKQEASIYG